MFKLSRIVDVQLLLIILALVSVGFLAISSATGITEFGQINAKLSTQMISFALGFFAMIVLMIIDYRFFGKYWYIIYALSIIALLLVYIPGFGVVMFNARSWVDLKFMYFQTSEIAKIGFIIALAKFFELRKGKFDNPFELILPAALILPIIYLLKEQPDLGTMLVFVFIFLGMIFVAGLNWKIIGLSVFAVILSAPLVFNSLQGYQAKRILGFLRPDDMSIEGNYQVMMSKLTIGSGGLRGAGLYQGSFSANNFLPVQESDFIFAVFIEEFGFVGGVVLIGLYFLLFTRLIQIAFMACDDFGTNIVIGVLFMHGFHVFQNIGMTMGLMPVTGVPLSFVSYGGSSLLINMISMGLVMSVYLRRKQSPVDDDIIENI